MSTRHGTECRRRPTGIALLVVALLLATAATADTCDPVQRPNAAALLWLAGDSQGTAIYAVDEDADRHYLITAYHNVYQQQSVSLAGLTRSLAEPLETLVEQVLYLPRLDLAVYPCEQRCREALEGEAMDQRRPILMRERKARWPGPGTHLSAIGNPRLQVAGRAWSPPINVAAGATVHSYAPLGEMLDDPAYDAILQPFVILSDLTQRGQARFFLA